MIFASFESQYCSQSNVFDAVSLFETNHVVHWNAPSEDIIFVWRHDFFVLRDIANSQEDRKTYHASSFLCHRTVSMAAVYQLKMKYDQAKF